MNVSSPLELSGSSESSTDDEVLQHKSDIDESGLSALPSFKPPIGWKRSQALKEASKFGIVDVQNDENEIWLLKVPSRVARADLSGKTFKLPTGIAKVPTKVAKLQKNLQETTFTSFQKKTVETTVTYGIYEIPTGQLKDNDKNNDEFAQDIASHQAILDKMQEFELLVPNKSSDGGLVLSNKKPDRYFNIRREIELPDPASNIEAILLKKPEVPQHPSESFIPRFITTFPEFSKKRMDEANLEKEKYKRKLTEEWKYNKWHKKMKKHDKKMREVYLEWQEKCRTMLKKSKEKFVNEITSKKTKETSKNGTDKKTKKRKLNLENDETDEEFLTTTDEEVSAIPIKKKIKSDPEHGKEHYKKILKSQYFANSDSDDSEVLAEVAEEEAEFAKMAQEQVRMKEAAAKNLEEAKRKTAETWTPSLVTYPRFEPPITWWSKTNEKIIAEEEEKKLRPYATKRDWTVEERMEYYKKYKCEPPPYPVPKQKGQEIEINYVGIYGKIKVPKHHQKRIKPPPKPGTTGYISPRVELIDE